MRVLKLGIFLFICLLCNTTLFSMEKILILNSYGEDFQWTSDEVDGILKGIGERQFEYDIAIEYMNWKKEFGDEKYKLLKEFYEKKYETIHPKLIVSTDNIAYSMAKNLRVEIFRDENIPIVFCGMNGVNEKFSYEESKSAGVVEVMSVEDNFNLIIKMNKNIKNVYVVNDSSETGLATKEEIKNIKDLDKMGVNIIFIEMNNISDFKSVLSKIDKESVVLQGISNTFKDGTNLSYENTLKLIRENTKVPVYSFWTFLLGKGIVGGKLLDGKDNGIMAGEIAVKILNGEKPENIGVVEKDINKYQFDGKLLEKYGIDLNKLPEDSMVENKKLNFYERNRDFILIFSHIFGIAIMVIMGFITGRKLKTKKQTKGLK